MSFERPGRTRSVKELPPVCGSPPDLRCNVCARFAERSPALAVAFSSSVRRAGLAAGDDVAAVPGVRDGMSVLVAGTVAHLAEFDDGRRHIPAFSFPGEPVTLGRLVPAIGAIRALSDCVLYYLPSGEMERFVQDHPAAAEVIDGLAHDVSRRLVGQIALLGRFSALERLAAFIADLSARIGVDGSGGRVVVLPMGRGEIADHLGMNMETVSRQFAHLKRDGLIRMQSPSRLTVPDVAALLARVPAIVPN